MFFFYRYFLAKEFLCNVPVNVQLMSLLLFRLFSMYVNRYINALKNKLFMHYICLNWFIKHPCHRLRGGYGGFGNGSQYEALSRVWEVHSSTAGGWTEGMEVLARVIWGLNGGSRRFYTTYVPWLEFKCSFSAIR